MAYAVETTGGASFPLRDATGLHAVAARILTRILTVRGEWPTDTTFGLPLLAWLETPPTVPVAEALYRDQIGKVRGVVEITSLTVTIDGEDMTVRASVEAEEDGDSGAIELGTSDPYDTRGAPAWYTVGGTLRRPVGAIYPGG